MAVGYGMRGHVLWNFQTAWGTSVVASQQAVPIISEGIDWVYEDIEEASMYGRFHAPPAQNGMQRAEGDIAMEAHPAQMGELLRAAFGQVTTTSGAGIQTHVFEPRTTDWADRSALPPSTVEIHRDVGSAFQFFDLVANKLALNAANGQFVGVTASMIGAGYTRLAAGTPTFPADTPFKWDGASVSWNGGAVLDFRSLQWSFMNNLEAQYTLNYSSVPYRIKRTGFHQVDVSGTIVFAQHSYFDAFANKTQASLVANFVGDTPHVLRIDIPLLRLRSFKAAIAGPGVVEASFEGRAIYLSTSATNTRVTLVNTRTYY